MYRCKLNFKKLEDGKELGCFEYFEKVGTSIDAESKLGCDINRGLPSVGFNEL